MTLFHQISFYKKAHLLLIMLAFLASLVSCNKETKEVSTHDPNTLPPLTHEGKNTFGCVVNGEVWVAYTPPSISGPNSIEGSYYSDVKGLYIIATRENSELNISESIDLAVKDLNTAGQYQAYSDHHVTKGFIDFKNNLNCSIYYYDTTLIRTINITYFSQTKRIVSGTFEMDLVNPSCLGDTIRVRDGRFDWRF